MSFSRLLIIGLLLAAPTLVQAQGQVRTAIRKPGLATSRHAAAHPKNYTPPRPSFAGLRLMMPADSARLIMKNIALRQTTHKIDSMIMIESDSIRIYGQPAYIQIQIVENRIRTIVINFHPLSGDRYFNTRNQITKYMEQHFGRGVVILNESITYRRWTNEDGQMEVSHSDKFYRVFIRLGKNPLT